MIKFLKAFFSFPSVILLEAMDFLKRIAQDEREIYKEEENEE